MKKILMRLMILACLSSPLTAFADVDKDCPVLKNGTYTYGQWVSNDGQPIALDTPMTPELIGILNNSWWIHMHQTRTAKLEQAFALSFQEIDENGSLTKICHYGSLSGINEFAEPITINDVSITKTTKLSYN